MIHRQWLAKLISIHDYRLVDMAWIAVTAIVYCALSAMVLSFSTTAGSNVTLLWLPGGLALAILLIGGTKLWPGVFIGAFAAGLMMEDPLWVSLFIALGNLLETITAVALFNRNALFDSRFIKPADFTYLIKVTSATAFISALFGPGALLVAGFISLDQLPASMLRWWQGDALGMLLLTPLILIWRQPPKGWFNSMQWLETTAWLSLSFIVNQIVFFDWFAAWLSQLTQNYWVMPFLFWSGTRRGTHGVTLFVAMTAIQAFEGARKGIGLFATDMVDTGLLNFWFFVLMISVVGIGLALILKAQERLKHHLQSIIDSTSECIKLVARDGKLLAINPAGLVKVQADCIDEVLFKDIFCLIAPEHKEAFKKLHLQACDGKAGQLEFEIVGLKGTRCWMESRVAPFFDDMTGETIQLAFTREITERKAAEQQLNLAASVFKHAREGISITDACGNIINVNDTFCEITGYNREEVLGKNSRVLQSDRQTPAFYQEMWRCLVENGYWHGEIWNCRKSGEIYPGLLTISAVHDETGKTVNYVGLFNDITPIKNREVFLESLAHYDMLTSLPNRLLLMDRLQQAMAQCERSKQLLAVVFIDLDGFKRINDLYSHEAGDHLLITVAHRLKNALRDGDTLARLGGDEFIGILVGLDDCDSVKPVLDRLLKAASAPVMLNDLILQVSASIGVCFYRDDNQSTEQLIRHADQAMYKAKHAGKNRFNLYQPSN